MRRGRLPGRPATGEVRFVRHVSHAISDLHVSPDGRSIASLTYPTCSGLLQDTFSILELTGLHPVTAIIEAGNPTLSF